MAVKKKKVDGWLEAVEYLADVFEKETGPDVGEKLPEKCCWYAFGPGLTPEEAANFLDYRKFAGYDRISKLTNLPAGAIWGVVFW